MMPSRFFRAPLRARVLAGVLSVTLAALAAFDVAVITAIRQYLVTQTDSALQTVLNEVRPQLTAMLAAAGGPPPSRPPALHQGQRPAAPHDAGLAQARVHQSILGQYNIAWVPGRGQAVPLEVAGSNFKTVVSQVTASGRKAPAAGWNARPVTIRVGQGLLRLNAVTADAGTLVASTSLDQVDSTIGRLELVIILGSVAVCLLVFAGVGVVMRRGLRPVEAMAAQADRITAGDLTHRVSPEDTRSEVGRLGAALNGMLTRIEGSIAEREASQELMRRFFADASHELRTPLASLRANAELYQQGALRRRPEIDEAMRRIALEAQRMSGLVDDMLRLARLDQHPSQQRDPVDLTALAHGCAERAQVADPRRTFRASVAPGLVTIGDEEFLRRAIDNLLANVRAHTPDGTVATITAASHGDTVTVEVSDNGPGVPAGQLPRIFDRFYRAAAPSHRPGSGLGLAIVAAIAAAHGGTAEAAPSDPHGLRVTLTLPVRSEPAVPAAAGAGSSAPAVPGSASPGRR